MLLVSSCSSGGLELTEPIIAVPAATVEPTQAEAPTAAPTTTPIPTVTPVPTPTPVPLSFDDELAVVGGQSMAVDLVSALQPPLGGCDFVADVAPLAGGLNLQCTQADADPAVVASAPGRIVHIVREAADAVPVSIVEPQWSWSEQAALGTHIVVDHEELGGRRNVQTVYGALASIPDDLRIGQAVSQGQVIGAAAVQPAPALAYSVWVDGTRLDGKSVLSAAPGNEEQLAVASALGAVLSSPVSEQCRLIINNPGQLPNAPRAYRNGTHRGIDLGCPGSGNTTFASYPGTVVYLVDDYKTPSASDRNYLLNIAGRAESTPHWTLMMLYGNVVIVDHGEIPGAGNVVTISAHLQDVYVELGDQVTAGQPLGEVGNQGTNAAAVGVFGADDPSLHLHWELYINGWHLGQGLLPSETAAVVRAAMCGTAATPGC